MDPCNFIIVYSIIVYSIIILNNLSKSYYDIIHLFDDDNEINYSNIDKNV